MASRGRARGAFILNIFEYKEFGKLGGFTECPTPIFFIIFSK
jgi:hypothetical protein